MLRLTLIFSWRKAAQDYSCRGKDKEFICWGIWLQLGETVELAYFQILKEGLDHTEVSGCCRSGKTSQDAFGSFIQ